MSTHDYVIDNQSAPAFRADLNSALAAIVTQNAASAAPSVTYANMIWYDTTNNQIKKRDEANSAWVTLGTIDEGAGTFTPSGAPPTQSQVAWDAGVGTVESLISPAKLSASFTTTRVLSATAGASAGAVGTYGGFSPVSNITAVAGDTLAGSSLRWASVSAGGIQTGATVSGTWQLLGYLSATNRYAIWQRIA